MKAKKYLLVLLSMVAFVACSDLEDTYSEYAGDGQIRYLVQCSDLKVTPGWEELVVTWKNSTDPVIAKIKVTWTAEGKTEEVLLEPSATEYVIKGLTSNTYEVSVCGVDKDGNTALPQTNTGRPYSEEHEVVQNFPQLVVKHFFVKDRLVLFFSDWVSELKTVSLHYTKADGTPATLVLDSALVTDHPYYLLEDAIKNEAVTLERKGVLSGVEIDLPTKELVNERVFSSEFRALFRAKFGVDDPTEEQLQSLEVLEIDYSLNSLEDILYLPNLKELHLGKNRYLKAEYLASNENASVLYEEEERSIFAIEKAYEIFGLEVWRYNKHFLPDYAASDFFHPMSNPEPEDVTCLSSDRWDISCTPTDETGIVHLEYLFDGNEATVWETALSTTWREHVITIDMVEEQMLNGLRFVQQSFNSFSNDRLIAPVMVKIEISMDGREWQHATYLEENTLGNTGGEVTIIRFPNPQQALFIRFTFNDQASGNNFGVAAAEIRLF